VFEFDVVVEDEVELELSLVDILALLVFDAVVFDEAVLDIV
jgi:hypothetical protein